MTPDRELSAQYAATKALADAATLPAAMPAILRAVCENLDWEVGAYWEIAPGSEELACKATWRPPNLGEALERTTLETRFKRGEGLPGRVWQQGRWVWVDVARTESPRVAAALKEGLRAAFAYPITGPAGYFGILEFSSREIRSPDERLLTMLGSIASQVAQFLDRRRAEDSTRFLSEASALLATSLDYGVTLQRLATLSVPVLGDWCAVDVVQDDRPFRRVAVAHVNPALAPRITELQERWPPDPAGASGYPKVLRTGEPDYFPYVPPDQLRAAAKDADHQRYFEMLGYRSLMCVPLTARGRVLGAMTFVIASGERRFEPRDFALAQDLGRRAGQAIDNARLFREVERGHRHAALLVEASRVLAAAEDIRSALEEVCRIAAERLDEEAVFFLIWEDGVPTNVMQYVAPEAREFIASLRTRIGKVPPNLPLGTDHAIRSGTTETFSEADVAEFLKLPALSADDRAALGELKAGLTAPMTARGKTVGALVVRSRKPGRSYSADEIELAKDLAHRGALAYTNFALHKQAEDAVRARDEFLSVASHELRTPLTALDLLVRTLRTNDGKPATLSPEKLEIAERQIARINKLVDQLFDLSRVTSGQLELEIEDVDLSAVAREAASRMSPEAFEYGCVVAVRTPAPSIGKWDRFRLEQVATNLLSNALKFGRGKPVEIAVEDRGAQTRLTVRDAGIGILPEHVHRIFERFSRGNPGRRYDGLGLGLYIIKQIVDALGGRISVESEPGRGALFIVDLPKVRPEPSR